MPLRTSALRTLGAYANVFAVESFMDELAAAPASIRSRSASRISRIRARKAVIEAAAKAADWKPGEKGDGTRGRGFAFATLQDDRPPMWRSSSISSSIATAARSRCRAPGRRSMPGRSSIPDGLINQIEGGIVQSTSWTLHEQVRFDKSGILSQIGTPTRS